MKANRFGIAAIAIIAAAAFAPSAWAHPGHGGNSNSFAAGLLHPLTGVDHVLAALAVGLYAATVGRRAWGWLVAAFLACVIGGGILGRQGVQIPWIEHAIAASVLAFGLLIAARARLTIGAAACLIGFFATFHGYAHGSEMAAGLSGAAYGFGFSMATALLLAAGVALGRGFSRYGLEALAARLVGSAVAIGGLLLFVM